MPRVKIITIKVFQIGNKQFKKLRVSAPHGRHFTDVGVQGILHQIADRIESEYPNEEFELKELTANQFNFVWKCSK